VSVENLGPFSSSTLDFLRDLGRRISHISGDDREVLFVVQRISVTIQRQWRNDGVAVASRDGGPRW